jgi:hypothetical protein
MRKSKITNIIDFFNKINYNSKETLKKLLKIGNRKVRD